VRFTITLPTLFCGHCHCTMCRRSHGAGYVTWIAVPRERFVLDAGDAQLVRFRSSHHGTRSFCGRCGSTLFCESTHHPDSVDIVLANLNDPIDRAPQAHVFFESRVDWVNVEDGLPRLSGLDFASERRARREAIVLEHMQSENVQDWERTIATYSHPRYELPDGRIFDGRDDVLRYWVEGRRVVPDQRNELIELSHVGDDTVQIEFWLRGTPKATNEPFEVRLWARFRFDDDDLMTNERVYSQRPK
jgi:hypothetical protein